MNKILDFFKNKSVGYYIAAADALLALVLGIVYMATYKTAIGANAVGFTPETVGIFMFCGFAIECVLLVLPQYGFINLFAIAMYGISFYKEVYLIPDFFAGKINNVEYNGGDFGLNLFYFIMQLIILASAIAATFLGFYKKEEEANEDFKIKKNTIGIAKVAAGLAVIIIAGVAGLAATKGVQKKEAEEQAEKLRLFEEEKKKAAEEAERKRLAAEFNPITDEVRAKAAAVEYAHDPKSLIVKQQDTYNFNDSVVQNVPVTKTRNVENVYLAYVFEGSYTEGWQGDYTPTYSYLYLWSDGVFGGTSGKEDVRGYWYNSSIENGKNEQGQDIADCLTMVSGQSNFASINTMPKNGFYQYEAYMYLDMGKVWNQGYATGRSTIMSGYAYYPEVDIAIHMGVPSDHVYHVGDLFSEGSLKVYRILKDLNYGGIFGASSFTITIPDGMVVDGKLAAAGDYTITATYNGMTTTKTITVVA